MHKTTNTCLIVIALGLLSCFTVHAKPLSPAQITIQALSDAKPNQAVEFVLLAESEIDLVDVVVAVEGSTGVVLHSGQHNWRGSLEKGLEKQLHFTAVIPENGEIIASMSAVASVGGQRLSSVAVYRMSASVINKLSSDTSLQGRLRFSGDMALREYSLD